MVDGIGEGPEVPLAATWIYAIVFATEPVAGEVDRANDGGVFPTDFGVGVYASCLADPTCRNSPLPNGVPT